MGEAHTPVGRGIAGTLCEFNREVFLSGFAQREVEPSRVLSTTREEILEIQLSRSRRGGTWQDRDTKISIGTCERETRESGKRDVALRRSHVENAQISDIEIPSLCQIINNLHLCVFVCVNKLNLQALYL